MTNMWGNERQFRSSSVIQINQNQILGGLSSGTTASKM